MAYTAEGWEVMGDAVMFRLDITFPHLLIYKDFILHLFAA
jgi:hypothetical protein